MHPFILLGMLGALLAIATAKKKPKDSGLFLRIERLPLNRQEKDQIIEAIESREGLLLESAAAIVEGFDASLAQEIRNLHSQAINTSEVPFEELEANKLVASSSSLTENFEPPLERPVIKSILFTIQKGNRPELNSLSEELSRLSQLTSEISKAMELLVQADDPIIQEKLRRFIPSLPYREKQTFLTVLTEPPVVLSQFAKRLAEGALNAKHLSNMLASLASLRPLSVPKV